MHWNGAGLFGEAKEKQNSIGPNIEYFLQDLWKDKVCKYEESIKLEDYWTDSIIDLPINWRNKRYPKAVFTKKQHFYRKTGGSQRKERLIAKVS